MADKKRLTEKHYNGDGYYMLCSGVLGCDGRCGNCEELDKLINRLGEYEDKAEQTVEVVHGEWESHPYHPGLVRCSKCKEQIIPEDMVDEEIYCSKCGTKLGG